MSMHIMLDLETADNLPTSAIIAIGAVEFTERQTIGRKFYRAVDLGSSVAAGLTVGQDTMLWWSKQSPEARRVFDDPARVRLPDALTDFSFWMKQLHGDTKVWGNGAAFDNAILSNAYARCGLPLPWDFWNDRCYRTVKARITAKPTRVGVYHNAVDDAETQARHLMQYAPEAIA